MKKRLLWMIILFPFLAVSCKDNLLDEVTNSANQTELQNREKSILHYDGADNAIITPIVKDNSVAKPPKRKDKDWETSVGN